MAIQGLGDMSPDQLRFEIQRGAKLVRYQYCVSLLVITFKRWSEVYYIPAGELPHEGTAVDFNNSRSRMVGHSVGTNLLRPGAHYQFQRREGSDTRNERRNEPHRARASHGRHSAMN